MLTQSQINIIIETMMPFKPSQIGVFGSMARGEADENSDIDILYSFSAKYTLFDLGGLYEELKVKLKREVDLIEFSTIHPKLKDTILADVKMVYDGKR